MVLELILLPVPFVSERYRPINVGFVQQPLASARIPFQYGIPTETDIFFYAEPCWS